MTSRFVLLVLIAVFVTSIPYTAEAQEQNKTRLVFEINSFPKITIPTVEDLAGQTEPVVEATPIVVEKVEVAQTPVVKKISKEIPPKVADDQKVYMHEPEIRAYICPKMGQKDCNIFIAVLKAENGTHECTRDNRGLNKNGSLDVRLAQINWNPKYNPPYSVEDLRDCKFNLDIAIKKYEARGFQPWYAYTKGAYKKFLKPAPQISAVTTAPTVE